MNWLNLSYDIIETYFLFQFCPKIINKDGGIKISSSPHIPKHNAFSFKAFRHHQTGCLWGHVAMEINIYISIWAMFLETLYLQACSLFTVLQPPLKMVFDICQWYIFYSERKNWFPVITSKWIACMYTVSLGDGWNVKAIFLVCHIGANIPDKMKIPLDFTFLTWGFTIPIVQVVVRRSVQTQQIK